MVVVLLIGTAFQSRPILSLVDLHDFSFDGSSDDAGLPHGNGTLTSDDETGQTEFCVRKVCHRAISFVYGTFQHGKMDGPVWIVYQDGGITISVTRESVQHGIFKV